jgi:hypothetical protein
MTNVFLPTRYDEVIHRLGLGIEPLDAARALWPVRRVDVVLDGLPTETRDAPDDLSGLDRAVTGLTPLFRNPTGRFVLLHDPDLDTTLDIRISDRRRRFVPRRLSYKVPAAAEATAGRIKRPRLFPAAAYDISDTATGLRGRVTWDSAADAEPVRWARVEATLDGQVVGRAHGDDRGEFLLLLEPAAGGVGELSPPLIVQVTVFAPAAPPTPPSAEVEEHDPLWDLPLEADGLPGDPDDTGATLPAGYAATPSSTRPVTFELGLLRSDEPPFFLTP